MTMNYLDENLPEDKNRFHYSPKERKIWLAQKMLGFNQTPEIWSKPKIGKKLGISHTQVNRDLKEVAKSITEHYDIRDLDISSDLGLWIQKMAEGD